MSNPLSPDTRFSEDGGDVMYLRDVARLVATERRQKRLVLSGEIITSEAALKQHLTEKLAMHSTNVRKSFRKLDRDYSGCLDRYEFRKFLENLNIHTTFGVFNNVFDQLDTDKNGTVEFQEFMKHFGPAIAGEELPIMMDGENRQTAKFQAIVKTREARAGCSTFTADEARKMLSSKLATMSNSVRKIFQHANTDFQTEAEVEGGLNKEEFSTILDKFNIPMKPSELDKLYNMLDPDGSGCITFSEFRVTFGNDISGGDSDIRWGATAVPKAHAIADKFSSLATAAERNASGPQVQSGGSLQATGTTGSIIQKEIQFNEQVSDFALKQRSENNTPGTKKEQGKGQTNVPPLSLSSNKTPSSSSFNNGVNGNGNGSHVVPSGGKMTKAAFVLQRRQQRDADKLHAHNMLLNHQHHHPSTTNSNPFRKTNIKNNRSNNNNSFSPSSSSSNQNNNITTARSNVSNNGGLSSARSGVRDLSGVAPMTNRPLESARRLRDNISQRERLNKMQQIQQQQQQQQMSSSSYPSSSPVRGDRHAMGSAGGLRGGGGGGTMTMTSSGQMINSNGFTSVSAGPAFTDTMNGTARSNSGTGVY